MPSLSREKDFLSDIFDFLENLFYGTLGFALENCFLKTHLLVGLANGNFTESSTLLFYLPIFWVLKLI